MAIGSFFKKIFGGSDPAPPPAPPADPLEEARHTARTADRRNDPAGWAQAQQFLARDLLYQAHVQGQPYAAEYYREAREILSSALEEIEGNVRAGHHPLFESSLRRLRGEAALRHADLIADVDRKGETLASAANDLGTALDLATPDNAYDLWLHAQLFRGAAFEGLARLKTDETALAWLDEAAACFESVATRGNPGGVHAIGAFNRYVVLEQRAARTPPAEARAYYDAARQSLVDAMSDASLAAAQTDMPQRLAALDAAIANLP